MSLKFVCVTRRVRNVGSNSSFLRTNILSFKFVKCYWASTPGRRIWFKLWRKWMPIDEIVFAVSCSATVTDEFELQLTKTGDKARNRMTMFQNWSTKDEIETSIAHSRVSGTNWKNIFWTYNCISNFIMWWLTVFGS